MKKIVTIVLTILCIAQSFTIAVMLKIDKNQKAIYQEKSGDDIYCVSLINLIASPEKFDGKRVSVSGIMCMQYEETVLYLSYDDYDNMVTKNSIWIDIDSENAELDKVPVIIEGTYHKVNDGFINMCSGSISDITRIEKSYVRKNK